MLADDADQGGGCLLAAAPLLADSGASLLGFGRINAMEPDAGVAYADGVAVDDAGYAGQRRPGGFSLGATMTMIVAGLAVVVAALLVQATAVGRESYQADQNDEDAHRAITSASNHRAFTQFAVSILW